MRAVALVVALLVTTTASADSAPVFSGESPWSVPTPWRGSVVVGAGGAYHQLFGIPYGTASVFARYGRERRHFGVYGEVMVEAGAVLPRLPIEIGRVGLQLLYRNGRFRAGAGLRFGGLALQRATDSTTASAFAFSVYSMFSVDLYRSSKHALFLGAEVGFDLLAFAPSADGETPIDLSPQATLELGFRL